MDRSLRFRRSLQLRLAHLVAAGSAASFATYACGGDAVVTDGEDGGGGAGQGGAGASGASEGAGASGASGGTDGAGASGEGGTSAGGAGGTRCGGTSTGTTGGPQPPKVVCLDELNGPCPASLDGALPLTNEVLEPQCCATPDYTCFVVEAVVCGPYPVGLNRCCFDVAAVDQGCAVPGRPLAAGEEPRVAALARRADWGGATGFGDCELNDATRSMLSERWAREALYEHASIASFARFTLELMAVGAPADLIREAHEAGLDEVRHAELAFSLAARYGAEPLGPDSLLLDGLEGLRTDLASMAAATVTEGCIGETIASVVAAERALGATDAAVRAVLEAIAEDEARHAELAYRTVAWAVRLGGDDVRAAVADAFEQGIRVHGGAQVGGAVDGWPAEAEAHGMLSPQVERAVAARAVAEVVEPSFRAVMEIADRPREGASKIAACRPSSPGV